ncbi:MAG: hypothetical protein JSS40_18960 [Proteobacteria bacterium]|nr:hypothetical protein [Pseudomonadota bacterium]
MTPEHAPSPEHAQGMSRLNPAALGVADAARVLSRIGGKPVTEEMLRADIDAGAPTNANSTINLVQYAAWLVKEMSVGGAGGD